MNGERTNGQRLADWIEQELARQGVQNLAAFTREHGVDRSQFYRWKNGEVEPSVERIEAWAQALGRTTEELMIAGGYAPPPSIDIAIEFDPDPRLTPEGREALRGQVAALRQGANAPVGRVNQVHLKRRGK